MAEVRVETFATHPWSATPQDASLDVKLFTGGEPIFVPTGEDDGAVVAITDSGFLRDRIRLTVVNDSGEMVQVHKQREGEDSEPMDRTLMPNDDWTFSVLPEADV